MLGRSIKIYSAYFAQFLKSRLEYRGDFLFNILAQLIMTLSGLLFIYFLLDGETIPDIQGWSRSEVMFIYGYAMIPMAIFMTFAMNLYQFGDRYIVQGQFDRVLLRPLSTVFQVLFESFNMESIGSLVAGLGVLLYTASELRIHLGMVDYLWLLVSSISGGVILISVFVFIASLSFHFEDRLGIGAPVFSLITFGRYPITIFNRTIQIILKWVIPFAFVAFYPATHFFDRSGFEALCYLTPVVAVATAAIAAVAWQYGVSKYSSTGN